jgi:hypothetical protein
MRLLFVAAALAVSLAPVPVLADPPGGCPPGLAKKGSCVPPGHAKAYRRDHDDRDYRRYYGDRVRDDYYRLRDPGYFRLDPRYNYYIRNDRIYRVDPNTQAVLDLVGALNQLLN